MLTFGSTPCSPLLGLESAGFEFHPWWECLIHFLGPPSWSLVLSHDLNLILRKDPAQESQTGDLKGPAEVVNLHHTGNQIQ